MNPECSPSFSGEPYCYAQNGEIFTAQTGQQFEIQCGTDYMFNDISNVMVSDDAAGFASCMNQCAALSDCTTVVLAGVTCYLKSAAGPSSSSSNIYAAVMLANSINGQNPGCPPSQGGTASGGAGQSLTLPDPASLPAQCQPAAVSSVLHLPTPTVIANCFDPAGDPTLGDDLVVGFRAARQVNLYTDFSAFLYLSTNGVSVPCLQLFIFCSRRWLAGWLANSTIAARLQQSDCFSYAGKSAVRPDCRCQRRRVLVQPSGVQLGPGPVLLQRYEHALDRVSARGSAFPPGTAHHLPVPNRL